MRHIALALLVLAFPAYAQTQAVYCSPNGTLLSPSNLWTANALGIDAALGNVTTVVAGAAQRAADETITGAWLFTNTLSAPNATITDSNSLANVAELARVLSYKFPLTQQGENLTRSDGQDFWLNPWRGFAASDSKGMYIPPGTRWMRVRATLTTTQNVTMSNTNMQMRVFIISHNGTAGAFTHWLPDTDSGDGTWPASGTLSGAWSAFSVSHPAGGRGNTYDSGWVPLPAPWSSRIDAGTVLFNGVRLRNQTGGNLTDAWISSKPFMGQVEFSPF